jgi:ABC-type nitrate/sulfonate/bicarbonate transport system ATPase subunit
MAINRTGFEQTNTGLVIDKDIEAQLTYTFDWSEWLPSGDTVATAEYEVAARRNDPAAMIIQASGIDASNTKTYVELSGGAENKVYIITAKVTTADGLVDRRNFRVNVVSRSA